MHSYMSKQKTLLIVLTGAIVAVGALFAVRAAGSNPDRILARADKFFQEQAFDNARLEYIKVLRVDNNNARALRQLGLTWAEMGVPVQSEAYFTSASALYPSDLTVKKGLAKALFATNQFAKARVQAVEILGIDPTDGETLLMMAKTSSTEEDLAELSARVTSLDSEKNASFHLVSAVIASKKGDKNATKASLDKALALSPDSDTVHSALAAYYEEVRDRAGLLSSLKRASGFVESRTNTSSSMVNAPLGFLA